MIYYVTMLFNFLKTRQVLIFFETPGDQRSATVIYSSSTRHNKNSTSEGEVMNFFTGGKQ